MYSHQDKDRFATVPFTILAAIAIVAVILAAL